MTKENIRQDFIALLRLRHQTEQVTSGLRAALTAAHIEKIGYDPFADDPSISPEIVR